MERGQVTLEYFLLFAVVIVLTLLSVSAFDDDMRASLEGFFGSMSAAMSTPTGN